MIVASSPPTVCSLNMFDSWPDTNGIFDVITTVVPGGNKF